MLTTFGTKPRMLESSCDDFGLAVQSYFFFSKPVFDFPDRNAVD